MGATTVVVTKEGARYILLNVIEEPRVREEEHIEELGFEVKTQPWYENHNLEFVKEITGNGVYGSDIPFPGASDAGHLIETCQYSLTDNDIARYLYLGETSSRALRCV